MDRNAILAKNPDYYFSLGEYLLADSAFSIHHCLLPKFKKYGNKAELQKDE
jgi:hypothetical protein